MGEKLWTSFEGGAGDEEEEAMMKEAGSVLSAEGCCHGGSLVASAGGP